MDELHRCVLAAIEEIRRRFDEAEIPEFRLDIEVNGRVPSGSLAPCVVYKLSPSSMYSVTGSTEGARLSPVIDEALRRHGWQRRNDPLALPAPVEPRPGPDEIEF